MAAYRADTALVKVYKTQRIYRPVERDDVQFGMWFVFKYSNSTMAQSVHEFLP